jgi:hypothetical protein
VQNASGYVVEYATDDSFTDAQTVPVSGTSTTLTNLMANKTYFIRVMATGTGAYADSGWSGKVSVKTEDVPQVTLGNFRSTDKTENSVTLTWNAVTGATGYEIRYRTMLDPGSDQWKYVPITGITAVIDGLAPSTTYEFQIRSRGTGSANSGWSTGILITTYAESSVVTNTGSIDKNLNTVKGVKLDKKESKPTQSSLAFTWYPASLTADSYTFDVVAPKPKGWAKKASAPCVATVSMTAEELAAVMSGSPCHTHRTG